MNIKHEKHVNTEFQQNVKAQQGFTLVELLVALSLGLLITAAVVQTFLSSKQTYRVSEGVNRVQENARFAMYFISRGVRDAGRSACLKRIRNKLDTDDPEEYLAFRSPVQGWNYNGTDSDEKFTLDSVPPATNPGASNWTSRFGTDGAGDPETEGLPAFLAGQAIKGSDVLAYKAFEQLPINLRGANNDSTGALVTLEAHGLSLGDILLVGDCNLADLFQFSANMGSPTGSNAITAAPRQGGGLEPGNRNLANQKWGKIHTPNSKIFAIVSTYYWVGIGAGGQPSLFRAKSTRPLTTFADATSLGLIEELVEGVESLQFYFGEDTNGDKFPNRFVSGNNVNSWADVVSMRLGLLFKSPEFGADFDQDATYTLLDNIELEHDVDDRVLRYTVNSTIELRNRGLADSASATFFNAERPMGMN